MVYFESPTVKGHPSPLAHQLLRALFSGNEHNLRRLLLDNMEMSINTEMRVPGLGYRTTILKMAAGLRNSALGNYSSSKTQREQTSYQI